MRSRLYNHQQNENNQKIMKMIIIAILLTIFMVTVGFKLLINSVVFINNLVNPSVEESVSEISEDFYGSIDVDTLPTATNAAELYVSGSTQDFDLVDIYINNSKADSVTVKGKNSFTEKIGKLKEGDNKIYFIARTGNNKQSKQTDFYTVYYKKTPLKLEIETPTADMTSNKQEIQVKGTTDPGTSLKINNQPVVIDLQGAFDTTFRLKEGENTLLFHATDIAGNTEDVELKVKFERDD